MVNVLKKSILRKCFIPDYQFKCQYVEHTEKNVNFIITLSFLILMATFQSIKTIACNHTKHNLKRCRGVQIFDL